MIYIKNENEKVLFADKGPHFYIHMNDTPTSFNKSKKMVSSEKETCFGRIIEGQEILDFMASHHDENFRGMSMVGIETIRILQNKESSF